jgi:hypothetical protein
MRISCTFTVVLAFAAALWSCGRRDDPAEAGAAADAKAMLYMLKHSSARSGRNKHDEESAEIRAARQDFIARMEADRKAYEEGLASIGRDARDCKQFKPSGKLPQMVLSIYEGDIETIQRAAERFHSRRVGQWEELYEEWEQKKWANYEPPELKTYPWEDSIDSEYNGRFGMIYLMACPTPEINRARVNFLNKTLDESLAFAEKLEARRANEESVPPTAEQRAAALKEAEMYEAVAHTRSQAEWKARCDEVMLFAKDSAQRREV